MAKNNKQSKQKKSVLNKLGGLSKRSKFIVVVLIFAVLGGGYLTYKSFAATAGPSPVRTEAANLRLFDWQNGCTKNLVNDTAKNNAIVMNVYCPAGKGLYQVAYAHTTAQVTWPQGTYKTCAMVKGVGKFAINSATINGPTGERKYNINSPDYKEYCSYAATIGTAGRNFYQGDSGNLRDYDNPSPNPTLLTIASITMYWYAPGVAPAPSGK